MSAAARLLLALAACGEPADTGAPAGGGADTEDRVEDPSPWTWTPAGEAPDLDEATLQAAASAGLAALGGVTPPTLYEAYAEAMTHATGQCPAPYPAVGWMTGWAHDCTTADGWGFAGRSQTAWKHDMAIDGLPIEDYGEFITIATLTSPAGGSLDIEGYGELWAWADDAGRHTESWLFGTFTHVGPWLEESWLDAGAGLSLRTTSLDPGEGPRTVSLDGGISRPGTLPAGTVGVLVRDLVLVGTPEDCAAAGVLTVQGAEGQRYTVDLAEAGEGATGCAPCAPARREGAAQGTVCLDLGPLLDWTGRPW